MRSKICNASELMIIELALTEIKRLFKCLELLNLTTRLINTRIIIFFSCLKGIFHQSGLVVDKGNEEMSDSDEEEYNTNGIVYDSDETDEENFGADGSQLSEDKRKVLVRVICQIFISFNSTKFRVFFSGLLQPGNISRVILHTRLL